MKGKVKVEQITPEIESEALKVLIRAILDDPTKIWFFEDGIERIYHTTWILQRMSKVIAQFGHRYTLTVDSQPVGTALWIPPDMHMTYFQLIKNGLLKLPFKVGLKNFLRIMNSMDYADKLQQEILQGRKHWQLYYIGVDPNHQGKGYGSKLMEPVLKMADKQGVPVFLENFTVANTRFYERNGFKVVKKHEFTPKALMRCMMREPK
jgi:GNAT superfamily N-acetyltransferase